MCTTTTSVLELTWQTTTLSDSANSRWTKWALKLCRATTCSFHTMKPAAAVHKTNLYLLLFVVLPPRILLWLSVCKSVTYIFHCNSQVWKEKWSWRAAVKEWLTVSLGYTKKQHTHTVPGVQAYKTSEMTRLQKIFPVKSGLFFTASSLSDWSLVMLGDSTHSAADVRLLLCLAKIQLLSLRSAVRRSSLMDWTMTALAHFRIPQVLRVINQ